jgi:hypothetical protein
MNRKKYTLSQNQIEGICDCIDSIIILSEALNIIGEEAINKSLSTKLNVEDIKEGLVDDKDISILLNICDKFTDQIEKHLDLQKELNYEIRGKIQEAKSWL